MKPNKFHSKYVSLGGRKIREERNICLVIRLFSFPQRLEMEFATTAARKVVPSSTLIGPFKILARAQIQRHSLSRSNSNRFSRLCRTWHKRHWLLRKRERMRDRKLVGSRQRSLSCRFILPRRERPLLAGKIRACREIKFDVTWSYVKRQTAKMTSEFVFSSSNPSLNHIKI